MMPHHPVSLKKIIRIREPEPVPAVLADTVIYNGEKVNRQAYEEFVEWRDSQPAGGGSGE